MARGRRRLGYRVCDGWWGRSGSHCSAVGWWQKRKEACSVSTQSPGNNKTGRVAGLQQAAVGIGRKDVQCPKGRPVLPEPDPPGSFFPKYIPFPALLGRETPRVFPRGAQG